MNVKIGDVFVDDFTYSCQVITSIIARVKDINGNKITFQLAIDECEYMIDDIKEIVVEKKFPLTLNYDNFYKIKIDKINKKYENISEEFWNKAYKSVKNKKHDALQDALDEIYWNDKHNGK